MSYRHVLYGFICLYILITAENNTYNMYIYLCSYVKTKSIKGKGGKITYQGGEVAIVLKWKDAPARGIHVVGQTQSLTLDQWKDYRTLRAGQGQAH